MDGAAGSEHTDRISVGRRLLGRPVVFLLMALLIGGWGPLLVVGGVQDVVEQYRIDSAERCGRTPRANCIWFVTGTLDGPVTGGPRHQTWRVTSDRNVVWVDLSFGDSDDLERVAPETVKAAVWNGEAVWLHTSLGRIRDTFHTYPSSADLIHFGIVMALGGVLLVRVAVALRRRAGSWWGVVSSDVRVDVTSDRAGRWLVAVTVLVFISGWSVGLSHSLWGLLVPAGCGGIYLWYLAASGFPEAG